MDEALLWKVVKDSISEGLLVCDKLLNIVDINRNLEIMLELSDWRGKSLIDVFPWRVKNVLNSVVREIESQGMCLFPKKFNFVTSKGVVLPLTVTGEVLANDQGGRLGYLFVFRDAIVQEEIGAFSWINFMKGSFLSEISRDAYLPIHNLSRLLEDYKEFYAEQGGGTDLLDGAVKELDRIRKIYDRLLEHARIDLVCEKLSLDQVSIKEIISRSLLLVIPDQVNNKVVVEAEGDDRVITDAFKLEQFFVLLLDFLSSARDEGKVNLTVRILPSQDWILVDLSDQGVNWEEVKDLANTFLLSARDDIPAWELDKGLETNLMRWIFKKLGLDVDLVDQGKTIRIKIPKEL